MKVKRASNINSGLPTLHWWDFKFSFLEHQPAKFKQINVYSSEYHFGTYSIILPIYSRKL
ncbi:hypothetical protein A9R00_02430 [Oleispira antarctica]|uniref:Uncharacterized protein n=1 Tax=Oleispira antarctica TaxID=188908 RepID=A0A1Y5HV20_OLEAN|nr:hypothetical protein A9R00_02430 [Oleispira antarctica]